MIHHLWWKTTLMRGYPTAHDIHKPPLMTGHPTADDTDRPPPDERLPLMIDHPSFVAYCMLSPVWDGYRLIVMAWPSLKVPSPLCIRVVLLPATACIFAALCCLHTCVQYRIDVVDAIGISFLLSFLASVCMTVEAVPWLSCLFVSCVFPAESYKPGKSWDPPSLRSLLLLSETFTVLLTPHVCAHLARVVGWLTAQ